MRKKLLQDRVAKILDEIGEANRAEAEAMVLGFGDDFQVAVAELLAHADAAHKLPSALDRLREHTQTGLTGTAVVLIYHSLGLQPSGAERS